MQKITFAVSVNLGKHGANLFVCVIFLPHLLKLQIKTFVCVIPMVCYRGQICSLTLNLYYYQINKFKGIISHLLSVQIWPSSPNSHTYQIKKFACIFLIFTRGQNIRWNPVNAHICYRYKYSHLHQIRKDITLGNLHALLS